MLTDLDAKRLKLMTTVFKINVGTCVYVSDWFKRCDMIDMQIKTLDQWIQIAGTRLVAPSSEPINEMVALRDKLKDFYKTIMASITFVLKKDFMDWIIIECGSRDMYTGMRDLTTEEAFEAMRHENVQSMLRTIIAENKE